MTEERKVQAVGPQPDLEHSDDPAAGAAHALVGLVADALRLVLQHTHGPAESGSSSPSSVLGTAKMPISTMQRSRVDAVCFGGDCFRKSVTARDEKKAERTICASEVASAALA